MSLPECSYRASTKTVSRAFNLSFSISFIVAAVLFSPLIAPLNAFALKTDVMVLEALKSEDRVRVMITLKGEDTPLADLKLRSNNIRQKTSRVLDSLSSEDFELIHRWDAVNALAGFISMSGVEKAEDIDEVAGVNLDEGGGGGLAQSIPLINGDIVKDEFDFKGAGTVVAILDTGIDTDNIDLINDILDEHCFCENSDGTGCCPGGLTEAGGPGSAEDDNVHGTNIAGIITSTGIFAIEGVAPDAKVIAVKVLDRNNLFTFSSQVISGLNWIILNHPEVDVVNMSLGTSQLFRGNCDNQGAGAGFRDAVSTMKSMGAVVVVSTQNEGSKTSIAAPACLSDTVAVSAVFDSDVGIAFIFDCLDGGTAADLVPCFANSNEQTDLLAPGARIRSTGLGGNISNQSGTSQAAAHVSAAAAVLRSVDDTLTPAEIEQILKDTGRPVEDPANGLFFPRIDLLAAVNFLVGPLGEDCTDGLDNDGNDRIDCEDEACDGLEKAPGFICEFRRENLCMDGFDNDADGRIDGDDGDCKEPDQDIDPIEVITDAACSLSSHGKASPQNGILNHLVLLLGISAIIIFSRIGRSRKKDV